MSDSARPLISVIIPTRERAETLYFAVQTALDQTSNNFEVIVSDNFSQDNTTEVVRNFSDPRLVYFNTGQRLSMCDNWEFALEKVKGEYIVFIGDDDAVMPGGINRLQALIQERQSDVYTWGPSIYTWPIDDRKATIEYLQPVRPIHEMNLQRMASFVITHGGWQYYRLPGVYHAAVSIKILDMIRKSTGRVFHTTQPDVFTSLAVPVFAKTCINTGHPVTVHGRSAKSNGAASVVRDGVTIQSTFIREYANYQLHPTLFPGAPVWSNLLGDTCLVTMDKFPEFYGKMKFNYEAMWAYLWQLQYVSFWEIIMNRSNINKYHSFRAPLFSYYVVFQGAVILRRRILNKLANRRQSKLDIPENIQDFANLLSRIQERKFII
ncbi:MAG TPA: glycosyltransferase family 2 protein [Anaerolineales bacterium]|nr:glycosyltransferase family 2 protein [Anaerolineales bacterium]